MRIAYLLGYGLGFAVQTIAGRPTQNDRLRAERDAALRDVYRLAKLLDNMRVDLSRAEAMLQHPSSQGAAGTSRDEFPAADLTTHIVRANAFTREICTGEEDFCEWDREFAYDQEADQ